MSFTSTRRFRKEEKLRSLIKETELLERNLIYPVFVTEEITEKHEMDNMPDVFCYNVEQAIEQIREAKKLGIGGIVLRPMPPKHFYGDWDKVLDSQDRIIKSVTKEVDGICVFIDGFFTTIDQNGFYGIRNKEGTLDYRNTIKLIEEGTVRQVQNGADVVLSLGRIDNAVGTMRMALDSKGYCNTPILSYSSNIASTLAHAMLIDPKVAAVHKKGFLDSKIGLGNAKEAMRQMEVEVNQGADMLGFKPALVSMDIIAKAKERFNLPTAAYIVSKEYSMIKAGAKEGYLDEKDTVMEFTLSLKRAGADNIMTYWAIEQAKWIKEERG